ncbi:class B sortase [Paenibacillus athensensis]|uniref:SrtB family sortase n=1 Tax=Paenibacillus athensensis TaxID=1967502 RepID=A0A4Y8PS13_9BACL|nr:class B sortase [Paenibacillus athensensis]MCD1259296.1 class B sortase [Paenibacillus athensensis]
MTLSKRFTRKNKRFTVFYGLAIALLFAGIVVIAIDASMQHAAQIRSQQLKQELKQLYLAADSSAARSSLTSPIPAGDQADPQQAASPEAAQAERWERLRAINPETVGWLRVEGTDIDDPIVQHADNAYYLNVDVAGRRSMYGSIFMDFRSDFQRTQQNIVIYGHNMLDGSMFGSLQSYKNRTFFDEHRFISVETPSASTKWEIFSVYTIDAQKDEVDVNYADEQGLEQAVDGYRKRSLFPGPLLADNPERLLTLVTCSNETDDTRLVLHAFPVAGSL